MLIWISPEIIHFNIVYPKHKSFVGICSPRVVIPLRTQIPGHPYFPMEDTGRGSITGISFCGKFVHRGFRGRDPNDNKRDYMEWP